MTCLLCGLALAGPTVNAKGDVGEVHVACFTAFDQASEAAELGLVLLHASIPPAPARQEARRG